MKLYPKVQQHQYRTLFWPSPDPRLGCRDPRWTPQRATGNTAFAARWLPPLGQHRIVSAPPQIQALGGPKVSGTFLTLLWSAIGAFYFLSLALNGFKYPALVEKVDFYTKQFSRWNSTALALKEVEEDFRRIFSLPSKERILETIDTSYSGSIDIQNLMLELEKSVESVAAIKDYLRVQKDIYLATSKGYPVPGKVTSGYGKRENPITRMADFHSGIDISASSGTPIRATADGVVSYSGWTAPSGNVVILKHGFGFSTVYARNKNNVVKVGQKIKRGDHLGYVGSTGNSTGPHVHYEIWAKGKAVNPRDLFQGGA
jgi:murein DD-endopeptidase MepM/ murein hydrolase activator NlpD